MIKDTQARNIKPGDKNIAHGKVVGLSLKPSDSTKAEVHGFYAT